MSNLQINKGLLYEYEEILLGERKNFSSFYFSHGQQANQNIAICIFRYAFEIFLSWTPEDIKNYINKDIIELMKLDKILIQFKLPEELDYQNSLIYIVHLMYPDIISFDRRELAINVYKRILNRELNKFPKKYLDGADGEKRACVCFQYMLEQLPPFKSVEDMYIFFSSSKGINKLKEFKLYIPCTELFETPIDFLYLSLPEAQQDYYLYHYYKFQYIHAKILKKERIKQRKENN